MGWHVVTPFILEENGEAILVNRGWVPKTKSKRASRPEPPSSDSVLDITGLVRTTEPRQQFTPKNQVESNTWVSRDIPAMANKLNTLPIFIDADAESSVKGGPIGGQTRIQLRNEHLSYMLTW